MRQLKKITAKLEALIPTLVGERSIPSVIRKLNSEITEGNIHFYSERYEGEYYKDHQILVSGEYTTKILCIPDNIKIILSFPVGKKKAEITEVGAKFLLTNILKTIYHEMRHRQQNRKRRKSLRPKTYKARIDEKNAAMLSYYGSPDEIDAHAFETKVDKVRLNRLRVAHKIGWKECEAIYIYRKYFRKRDSKVWKRFLKKVYNAATRI